MCKKKAYVSKLKAKQALFNIMKKNEKQPWRDELSVHLCDECGKYHLSSLGGEVLKEVKEKSYFDVQREKWGGWLQKYSGKRGNIEKKNKKYST